MTKTLMPAVYHSQVPADYTASVSWTAYG